MLKSTFIRSNACMRILVICGVIIRATYGIPVNCCIIHKSSYFTFASAFPRCSSRADEERTIAKGVKLCAEKNDTVW